MLKLSDQSLGAIMLSLQKSLLEQSDIVPVLKGFNFKINEKKELYIVNPPIVKFEEIDFPMSDGSD
jgi:hypothetical protein